MNVVDAALTPLSTSIGFPVDQLKFVLCVLLAYPLGYAHIRMIKGEAARHWFSFISGALMVYVCFGFLGVTHMIVSTAVIFGAIQSLPSKYIPRIAFVWMFSYLSALHIYRIYTDYMGWSMDVTASIMVATIKVTTLACNYADGKVLPSNPELLQPVWKEYAIERSPTLLEYYSYIFFYPTVLAGPGYHFKPYLSFIKGTYFKNEKFNPEGKMPDPTWPTISVFLVSILLIIVKIVVGGKFPTDALFDLDAWKDSNYIGMWVYLYFSLLAVRCQYYFIWKLAEGAGNLSGFGFSGYDKNGVEQWDRLNNVNILQVEYPSNLRDCTIEWNRKTGEWLRNYIYLRQTAKPDDKIPKYALYLTNSLSAFWHGFYPGYYCSFVYAAFTVDVARDLRSTFRPMVTIKNGKEEKPILPQKYVYDFLGCLLSMMTFNYGQASFVALSMENSLKFYKNFYFGAHVFAISLYALLTVYKNSQKGNKKNE